ncbi:LysR family transcriptional regulator [Marinomonas pollencensis]|uniref:DNA-binding transcriptional LysR family regulator n=1 Tax=Marinomonas pollencensis TaxID=491954 RepID=A0A3E0DLG5_9GAMM|nr:LysR family transcriptional regulator [Marinomonas pollencensis]REG83680.1 DNA-binding transcriptional LysR family regulator [Marinomonas pollencensis]
MNELECIRTFVKVVEAGSFTEAARQTGTVKSVITKRINQLEEHLELQLLLRSTRRLTVTDGGADFYQRSLHLLAELDSAKAAVSSVEWGLTGNFRVSCISSFNSAYLADDLCEFQQEHPDLKIELQQNDHFCDPVQEGYDVCLQAPGGTTSILEKVDILPLRRLIVATPDYLEKHGIPQQANELSAHRFAHNNHIDPDCVIRFMAQDHPQEVTISPDILTNTIWMLRAAVLKGEHMAMMPAFFIENELQSEQLVPVLPHLKVQSSQLSAYYRRSSFVPMKVRIFVNFLQRKYGQHPSWEKRILAKHPNLMLALRPSNHP